MLALAHERRVPVTPFGAGSSLEGHVIPVAGGISLDLTRMDRVLAISPADLTATVQAGVTRTALERAAAEHGLMFPVDPGADATLGGMAATNAAGTTTVRYGKMRANVLALRGRARRRPGRAGRQPGAEDVRRLRPPRPADRLGGNARGDHRADRPPPRDPRAGGRPAALVPRRRGGLPRGHDDRRRGRRRDARRAARLLDDRGDQRVPGDRPPGRRVAVRRGGGQRGHGDVRPRARHADRRVGGVARRRRRARPDGADATLGRPPRVGVRDGGRRARPAPPLHRHLRPALRARRRRLVRPAGARATRARRRPRRARRRRQRPPVADGRSGRSRRGRLVRRADRAARDGRSRTRRHVHGRARDRARQGARARA